MDLVTLRRMQAVARGAKAPYESIAFAEASRLVRCVRGGTVRE